MAYSKLILRISRRENAIIQMPCNICANVNDMNGIGFIEWYSSYPSNRCESCSKWFWTHETCYTHTHARFGIYGCRQKVAWKIYQEKRRQFAIVPNIILRHRAQFYFCDFLSAIRYDKFIVTYTVCAHRFTQKEFCCSFFFLSIKMDMCTIDIVYFNGFGYRENFV